MLIELAELWGLYLLWQLIYCSVCCQPFHSFCLEERDRPKDGCDTWCCLQCQFCHVCYGQSNVSATAECFVAFIINFPNSNEFLFWNFKKMWSLFTVIKTCHNEQLSVLFQLLSTLRHYCLCFLCRLSFICFAFNGFFFVSCFNVTNVKNLIILIASVRITRRNHLVESTSG